MKVWIDGEVVEGSAARVPVLDHGLLYGDGIFEGMRVYGGRLFRLDDHLRRLGISARAIGLEIPEGLEAMRRIVLATAREAAADEAYVRLIITRGEGNLGVDPTTCPHPRVICIVDDVDLFPEEKVRHGIDLVTASLRRPDADVLDPRVKSLNYLNNVLAKLEARRRGADDALILDRAGRVAEASGANVFILRGKTLFTPPPTDGSLEGITRATILDLAPALGLEAQERTLGRIDLLGADEVFLTGSGARVAPVRSLDGQPIGPGTAGPTTMRIREAFLSYARSTGAPVLDP